MKIITITTSNFLLLITGSLLPLICAKFNDGILLNTFNSYVIAIIFASVIDAFQIIQLEYIFSNASFNKLQRLTKSIISKNIAVLILASLAIFIEIYFFDSFFIIVIFSKHIFNYARVVYVLGLNQNSFVINLNLLGSFRNVLLCLSAFISQSPVFFALHIALISALEMGIIYLIVVHYYMLSMDASDIKLPDFPFIINKSIRSIRALDISLSAILNAIDRILITLFDPLIQIFYLKYKVVQQYIDGVFSIFSYQLHLMQMKEKKFPPLLPLFFILVAMTVIGFGTCMYLMVIEKRTSYIVLFFVCFSISLRRVFDGVSGAHLRSIKKYKLIIYKNFIEIIFIICAFLVSYLFMSNSADKIFIIYILFSLVSIPFLYFYYFNSFLSSKKND